MASNAASIINFGASNSVIGDWTYSVVPLASPGYLPLNSASNQYLISSYPTLATYFGGAGSTVAYSAAAITLPNAQWWGVEYGNGVWIALLQSSGVQSLYRSTNEGSSWSVVAGVPAGSYTYSVKYGNGVWIATYGAFYYRSTDDGVTWVKNPWPAALGSPTRLGFGNTVWVANGGVFGRSFDGGLTWLTGSTNPTGFSVQNIVYGGGVFVATGTSSSLGLGTYSITSGDFGATWSSSPVTIVSGINLTNGGGYGPTLAFGNGVFVVVGYNFDGTGYYTYSALYTSSNYGVTWTGRSIAAASWSSIAFSNNLFLAVAGNIPPNQPNASGVTSSTAAVSSPDGLTWTARVLPSSQRWSTIGGNNLGKFMALSGDNSYTSTAGALISFSATRTTFGLPVVSTIMGTTAYVKAT